MQMSKAMQLREAWKKKGDPPCDHQIIAREYYLSSHTGDSVCATCGCIVDEAERRGKKED